MSLAWLTDGATWRTAPRSLAVRLSILFAIASALILAGLGLYLYEELRKELAERSEEYVTAKSQIAAHVLQSLPADAPAAAVPPALQHLLVGNADLRLWVYSPDGEVLFASSPAVAGRADWERMAGADEATTAVWDEKPQRAYRYAVSHPRMANRELSGTLLVVALDIADEIKVLQLHRGVLGGAMLLAAVVASLLGYAIARRGLRSVARIAQTAQQITASALGERIDTEDAPQELQTLVESFNLMLARLEESFGRLSHFSADLAHELRTPLTSLLGRIQVTLAHPRGADEYREALEASAEDAERMSALIDDMLFLARADHAEATLLYELVDLRAETERLTEYFGMAAEERDIEIRVQGNAVVWADRPLLQRAISNLLSNAIRHSADAGTVEIELGDDGDTATVRVIDHGRGIPQEYQPRVFERFFRVDASRARESGGVGLGLAIVRSIARLHGGDVTLSSAPSQPTVFTLTVPVQQQPRVALPGAAAGSASRVSAVAA